MNKRFETVIFDLDGTLVDTVADVTDGVNHALKLMGSSPLSQEQVKKAVGPGKEEFIRIIFPDVENPDIESFLSFFREYYWDHCLDKTDFFPGMKEVLTAFKDRKLAVASNKPCRFTHRILEGLGVSPWFDAVLGPEDVTHAKPHPEMILKAVEALDAEPADCLLVGDTDKDMEAGRGAGVCLCGAGYGYGSSEDLLKYKPDYFIDLPSDLFSIIGNHQP
jgi:phosphoglycolate phosphatase